MPTLGNTATPPSANWVFRGTNVENQGSINLTMPSPGGYITGLHCYFGGGTGSAVGYVVLWQSAGANPVIASVNVGTVAGGASTNQAWYSGTIAQQFFAGGTAFNVGFAMPQSVGFYAGFESGGGSFSISTAATIPGQDSPASSAGSGPLGAYVDYTALVAPSITSVTPNHGAWGDTLVIAGSSFLQVSSITLNGTAVSSFTINSDTQITMTVPGATTGNLTLTNAAGSGSSPVAVSRLFVFDGSGLRNINWRTSDGTSLRLPVVYSFDGTTLRN